MPCKSNRIIRVGTDVKVEGWDFQTEEKWMESSLERTEFCVCQMSLR